MQQLPSLQPHRRRTSRRRRSRGCPHEVRALAAERNAVILAHNYQVPEIQDVADLTGDSLQLSREAAATDADVIAFCGVHFMAETASILSPEKTVLIPDPDAGCSLSDSINADQLRAWKAEHPGALVVMYVNTSAEVKAETDYCCTSSNAVKVVEHIWREHGPDDRDPLRPRHVARLLRRPRARAHRGPRALRALPRLGRRVPRPRRDPPRRHRARCAPSIPTPSS